MLLCCRWALLGTLYGLACPALAAAMHADDCARPKQPCVRMELRLYGIMHAAGFGQCLLQLKHNVGRFCS